MVSLPVTARRNRGLFPAFFSKVPSAFRSIRREGARGPFSRAKKDGLEAVLVWIVCYPQRERKFGVVLFFCGPFVSFGGVRVGKEESSLQSPY
jgi:hypothetical protein